MIPGDKKDQSSFKVRQGKVGGYVQELSEDDLDYINKVIEENGAPFYGI
jgi:hypothetical protein